MSDPFERVQRQKEQPINIFISHSHADAEFAESLEKHLSILKRQNIIDVWHDRSIDCAEEWQQKLDAHLNSSQIILLLISPDFLASDYCYEIELRHALERNDSGKAIVIPIILRPCAWENSPIAKLQVLPRDAIPITQSSNLDESFLQITKDLMPIIQRIKESDISMDKHSELELIINRNFDSYTEEDKEKLLKKIKLLLKSDLIKVIKKDRGSVRLRLRLSAQDVELLNCAVKNGELNDQGVVDAEVCVDDAMHDFRPRPSVFVGSSTEGLPVAEAIQVNLDNVCEVTIWNQGVFCAGEGTLEALIKSLNGFDFAIMVLTPDDLLESRGETQKSPRDNVIYELGLFTGHLGRERTFAVFDRTAKLKLPSDMSGVTQATYHPHSTGNLRAALGATCTMLKDVINNLGPKSRSLI